MLNDPMEMTDIQQLTVLVDEWERFVYESTANEVHLYNWVKNLDTRNLIEKLLEGRLPMGQRYLLKHRLGKLDKIFRSKTIEINESVWATTQSAKRQFDRELHWYYFRINEKLLGGEGSRFTQRE